jgi:regulator of sigma E protease
MDLISILYYIIPFIIVTSVIVFVHEFGHFWVARRCGVQVEVFSIGFGAELFGITDKHGTRWKFCLIPMGGYVKMFGDKNAASQADEEALSKMSSKEKQKAFVSKSLAAKSAIVVAGPAANYLLSAIIFSLFFLIYGYPNASTTISGILENSPASKAGIYPGDVINEINGKQVKSFDDIMKIMALNLGEEISIKVNDQDRNKIIKPEEMITKDALGNEVKQYRIGIIASDIKLEKQNIFDAIKLGVYECYKLSAMTLKAMAQMITGARSGQELGGPVKIAQYAAKSAESGFQSMLWFIALLSVNLGLINLLPIPVLDGGHLLIFAIEWCFGKKIAYKVQNYGFQIGIILLLILMVVVMVNDINSLLK